MSTRDYNNFKTSLKGKKILIWGLGISGGGVNVAKYFLKHGARVRITDMKSAGELQESIDALKGKAEFTLGEHKQLDFLWADLIIRNPAIPRSSEWNEFIVKNRLNVDMELNLFLKYYPGKVIGVTGTRGKSTTTALIYKILKAAGKDVITGGNNKLPMLLQLDKASKDQFAVIEMSSFQLSSITNSPQIAVVTNMYPDHLNWHTDMRDYIESKKNIVRFQNKGDVKVLNVDNPLVASEFVRSGKGRTLKVGEKSKFKVNGWTVSIGDNELLGEYDIHIKGRHNLYNIACAIAVAKELNSPEEIIVKTVRRFRPLLYRQQKLVRKGITFVNDSCATTPEGTIAALERFKKEAPKSIYLIAGGVNKDLDLDNVADVIRKDVDETFVLEGTFYDSIRSKLAKEKLNGPFHSFGEVFSKLKRKLKAGDYVVFSPGAASFNLFNNEWDRGEQFNKAIHAF